MHSGSPEAEVTVVISTYNRPAVLKSAIQSVLLQTFQNWQIYIVGDACAGDTGQLTASFEDPRIHFCNLPARCGEQSGPNSAGMAAANTEYIALLNQDDVWLPNHLETALSKLKKSGSAFYCSGFATTAYAVNHVTGRKRAVFVLKNKAQRTFEQMFYEHPDYLEPASAWVFTKELFNQVGPWRPAGEIYRTPLEDWLLRIWGSGAAHILSDELTVIKCNAVKSLPPTPEDAGKGLYAMQEHEQAALMHYLNRGDEGKLIAIIDRDIAKFQSSARHTVRFQGLDYHKPFQRLVHKKSAKVFIESQHDAFSDFCKEVGLPKGGVLKSLLQRRTGEDLPMYSNWDDMIHYAKEAFPE